MKIRQGFVSNSSSSSFVVSLDNEKSCKVKITLEVDLAKYGDKIKTKDDLYTYIRDNYCYDEEESIENFINKDSYGGKTCKKMLEAIQKGRVVVAGSFASDNGDPVEYFLCEKGLPRDCPDIDVIENEGGY